MKTDQLVSIIERYLETSVTQNRKYDEIITEAVGEYMYRLMTSGHIPNRFMDAIEADLKEEAWEILKKKTYGTLTPQQYKATRKAPRRKRATS